MASMKILAGDFKKSDVPVALGRFTLWTSFFRWRTYRLADVAAVESVTEEQAKRGGRAVVGGVAGALLAGPAGAVIGGVVGAMGKREVVAAVELKDGKRFLARMPGAVFEQLVAAAF